MAVERAEAPAGRAWNGWAIGAVAAAGAVVVLAASGDPSLTVATLAGVGLTLGATAVLVGAWGVTAVGLGVLARPMFAASREACAITVGVGIGLGLTVSHGLGVLGWLRAPVAIGLAVAGAAVCAWAWSRVQSRRRARREDDASTDGRGAFAWWAAVPIGVLIVAASAPAGWLWGSEFGAYDALAYHLQLPQEWMRSGRVWPVEHNVYSFLPSYVESAFVHLAQLGAAPVDGADGHGLTAGTAWRAQATHGLSAVLGVVAAWLIGRFTGVVLERAGADERARRVGSWGAGALALATPWVVVVGSIAYNETGVLALGAAAMLVAVDARVRPVWRGAIAGGLVGVACGCKPTAMVFVTPVVGVLLLGYAPKREWAAIVGGAVVMGTLALMPWLVRNWAATGNPVFPAMTGVFGTGNWTGEQAARFAGAHRFDGSWLERVRLLVANDPGAGEGAPVVARLRGAANPQWGLLFPMGVIAAGMALATMRTHLSAFMLTAGLVSQIVVWLVLTHLQSRFLLPCVLTLCPLVGVALGSRRVRLAARVGAGAVLVQTAFLVVIFAGQNRGHPNAATGVGLSLDLARPYSEGVGESRPWAWVNGELDPGVRVYLVGDAAAFWYERDVVVNSTYDRWLLGEAIEEHPGEPRAWTAALRGRGIDTVLVSLPEVARLERSGWIDPRVTRAEVEAWVRTLGEPEMVWGGRALFRIDEGGAP